MCRLVAVDSNFVLSNNLEDYTEWYTKVSHYTSVKNACYLKYKVSFSKLTYNTDIIVYTSYWLSYFQVILMSTLHADIET